MDLHEEWLDIRPRLVSGYLCHDLVEPLDHLLLFRGDPEHDLQISNHALDLPLQFALFADVEKGYDEIAEPVVDVGVGEAGEYPRPFPVLLGPEGMLARLS